VAGFTRVASWSPHDVAIGARSRRRRSWIRLPGRGELRVMWQERLPGAMLPRATSIRPGHGDRPRWPTRACQQWREQRLRTGLRPGSTSLSSLPPLCGVTVERASRHRADTRNPPKGQTFTPFDDGPGRRSSIAGPHEPPASSFRGSSSWVVYGGPRHTTHHARGTPLNRARALRRTAEIAPHVRHFDLRQARGRRAMPAHY
jgi:hypothetical protein